MSDPLGLLDEKDPLGLLDQRPTTDSNASPRKSELGALAKKAVSQYISGTEEFSKTAEKYRKPALQMAGGAIGATVTSALPGASIFGAGAGYTAGGKISDIADAAFGNSNLQTSKDVIKTIPKEFGEGMLSQIFNVGIDKFTKAAQPYLARAAEKVYSSAAKMPLSAKWIRQVQRPSGEVSDRLLATKAAIKERIPISEKGLEMARDAEASARKSVDDVIENMTQGGMLGKRSDLLKGLDSVYERAASSGDPQGAARIIDSVAKKFMKGPEKLTPKDIESIKRQMYKEASEYGAKFKSFHESSHKGIAFEARKALESAAPELAKLNEKDAAYIKLTEALEKATSREMNKYHIGLQDAVGMATGASYGALSGDAKSAGEGAAAGLLFMKIMRDPNVLSRLSFALDKASKMKVNPYLQRYISTVAAQNALGKEKEPQPAEQDPLGLIQ